MVELGLTIKTWSNLASFAWSNMADFWFAKCDNQQKFNPNGRRQKRRTTKMENSHNGSQPNLFRDQPIVNPECDTANPACFINIIWLMF